eukprot:6030174-Amphidinium_carterae.1
MQRSQRLVFFGGKGGVGKTSSSAAYAVGLADQGVKTLILSTDPAHSLGDALATPLSGTAVEVAENLWAAEVDTKQALAELREVLSGTHSSIADLPPPPSFTRLGVQEENPGLAKVA